MTESKFWKSIGAFAPICGLLNFKFTFYYLLWTFLGKFAFDFCETCLGICETCEEVVMFSPMLSLVSQLMLKFTLIFWFFTVFRHFCKFLSDFCWFSKGWTIWRCGFCYSSVICASWFAKKTRFCGFSTYYLLMLCFWGSVGCSVWLVLWGYGCVVYLFSFIFLIIWIEITST